MAQMTDFGFERVARDDKARRVDEVFASVARRYDLMNDLMSFGLHRLWKRFTVAISEIRAGQSVLDLAGGTGDLTKLMIERVGSEGRVVLADINSAMVEAGRRRLIDSGYVEGVDFVRADAQRLPFVSNSFDCICIGFGLRNVTDKSKALSSMYRVLRPGGQLLVLEFSSPTLDFLKPIYDAYSFRVLPTLGKIVANDADSYRYLAESIRMHPDQETLKIMMADAGFEHLSYHNLSAGIVAVHRGYKL